MKTIKFHTAYGLVTADAEVVSPKRLKIIKIVQVFGIRAGNHTYPHKEIPDQVLRLIGRKINSSSLEGGIGYPEIRI